MINDNMRIIFCKQAEVKRFIKLCEGEHIQQVAYSSYHDALTQICFNCGIIRTSLKEEELTNHSPQIAREQKALKHRTRKAPVDDDSSEDTEPDSLTGNSSSYGVASSSDNHSSHGSVKNSSIASARHETTEPSRATNNVEGGSDNHNHPGQDVGESQSPMKSGKLLNPGANNKDGSDNECEKVFIQAIKDGSDDVHVSDCCYSTMHQGRYDGEGTFTMVCDKCGKDCNPIINLEDGSDDVCENCGNTLINHYSGDFCEWYGGKKFKPKRK